MQLTPAYGRDYKSGKAVKEDWDNGKDFVIADYGPDCGRYINLEGAVKGGLKEVYIRFKKLQNVCRIVVK